MYFNFGFMSIMPFMGPRMTQGYYTGQPHVCLWAMNPGRLFGNYGGRPQFSTYPDYYSFQDVISCRHASNTFYYNNYFLNSYFSTLNRNSYNAVYQQQVNNQAFQIGVSIGTGATINSAIQSTANLVASLNNQLEKDINNNQITDEQKAEFEALKKQVEALEERLKQVIQDKESGSKNVEQIQAELRSISSDNSAITQKREELVQKINKAKADAQAQAEKERIEKEDAGIKAEAEAIQAKLEENVNTQEETKGTDEAKKAEEERKVDEAKKARMEEAKRNAEIASKNVREAMSNPETLEKLSKEYQAYLEEKGLDALAGGIEAFAFNREMEKLRNQKASTTEKTTATETSTSVEPKAEATSEAKAEETTTSTTSVASVYVPPLSRTFI